MGVFVVFQWLADFMEDHIFIVALITFTIVFMPAWMPLLKPPPKVPGPFLHPEMWQQMPLVGKTHVSHNTRRFRFALPHRQQQLGLPVGQHISLKADAEGPLLLRPYTPVTEVEQPGFVDFVIKVYPEGRMSQHLDKMVLGDCILAKGPKGRFTYQRNMKRHIGMVAGGTGITPMWQVLNHILRDSLADKTQISLIYANVTEEDILLREEMDFKHRIHGDKFKMFYTLDQPPEGWTGGKGFVTADMIAEHLPPPGPETLILRCGPPPMNQAVAASLDKLGYTDAMQFQF